MAANVTNSQCSKRPVVLITAVLFALLCLAGALHSLMKGHPANGTSDPQSSVAEVPLPASENLSQPSVREAVHFPAQQAVVQQEYRVAAAPTNSLAPAASTPPAVRSEPTPYTRQLVNNLSRMDKANEAF